MVTQEFSLSFWTYREAVHQIFSWDKRFIKGGGKSTRELGHPGEGQVSVAEEKGWQKVSVEDGLVHSSAFSQASWRVLSSCEDRVHCWRCSYLLAHFLVGNPLFLAFPPDQPFCFCSSWSFSVYPWKFWKFPICCNLMLLLFQFTNLEKYGIYLMLPVNSNCVCTLKEEGGVSFSSFLPVHITLKQMV